MASHRAPTISNRAAAYTVVGLTAGAAALVPNISEASPSQSFEQVKTEVTNLEAQAETVGQQYDATVALYAQLQQKIEGFQSQIATDSLQQHQLQKVMGLQAGAQYMTDGIDQTLQLALSAAPDAYLAQASAANEAAQQSANELKQLTNTEAQLNQDKANAAQLVAQMQSVLAQEAANKAAVQADLNKAQALLSTLTAAQQNEVQNDGGQTSYSGTLPPVSGRAGIAVAFAEAQVGKPYMTGGTGPKYWDCSGLTQGAWAAAGVSIERTSFEQWDSLQHIPMSDIQPGDLIFWRPSSEGPQHVSIYVGNNVFIQAPKPGGHVEYETLAGAGMTLVGAARP